MFLFDIFLVRIFPDLDWIRRDGPCLSVFGPNAEKYGPEKLPIRTLFTHCTAEIFFCWRQYHEVTMHVENVVGELKNFKVSVVDDILQVYNLILPIIKSSNGDPEKF